MHPFHLQNGSHRDNKISLSIDVVTCNSSVELDILDEDNTQKRRSSQVVGRGKKINSDLITTASDKIFAKVLVTWK